VTTKITCRDFNQSIGGSRGGSGAKYKLQRVMRLLDLDFPAGL
jgi:hypothetical protein